MQRVENMVHHFRCGIWNPIGERDVYEHIVDYRAFFIPTRSEKYILCARKRLKFSNIFRYFTPFTPERLTRVCVGATRLAKDIICLSIAYHYYLCDVSGIMKELLMFK